MGEKKGERELFYHVLFRDFISLSGREKLLFLLASGCSLSALIFLFILICVFPDAGKEFLPPCYFRETFGILCPGCGSTRSCMALWNGKFQDSFFSNPLLWGLGGLLLLLPFLPVKILFHKFFAESLPL